MNSTIERATCLFCSAFLSRRLAALPAAAALLCGRAGLSCTRAVSDAVGDGFSGSSSKMLSAC